ncbi:MAG: hypothetical protein P8J18_10010 [Halieaceae bacterium]|nr:hypothetical protein [Halieaceae bacterium]
MNSGNDRPMSNPDCWNCRHFFITFEKHHRYGCRAIGFKANELPCLEVLRTDGSPCLSFAAKCPEELPQTPASAIQQDRQSNLINLKC